MDPKSIPTVSQHIGSGFPARAIALLIKNGERSGGLPSGVFKVEAEPVCVKETGRKNWLYSGVRITATLQTNTRWHYYALCDDEPAVGKPAAAGAFQPDFRTLLYACARDVLQPRVVH